MIKILIIEDNDMLNAAYTFMLKAKGYEVTSAFDGLEGLEKAKVFNPDIILLDYIMPHLDGHGFLVRYDVAMKHPTVKVIVLTNLSDEEKTRELLKLGAYKCLLKAEVEPSQLIGIIRNITVTENRTQ